MKEHDKQENSLTTTPESNQIVKHETLLNYPSLTINDIEKSNISDLNREVIIASQTFPKIKSIDQLEISNTLIETIGTIIWESGFNIEPDEQKLLIKYMIEEIKRDFFHLTLEEVKIALKKGLRGHYGTVMGINIRMMYAWLEAYVEETKVAALKQLGLIENSVKEEQKEKGVTDEQKTFWHYKWLKSCFEAFDEYKEKKETSFIDINNMLYYYIRYKIKLVDLTTEEIENVWNHAINEYKRQHSSDKVKTFAQKIDYRAVLEDLKGIDKKPSGESPKDETTNSETNEKPKNYTTNIHQEKIKIISRRIALFRLFDKIILSNINFRDRIIEYEQNLVKKEQQQK